MNAIARALRIVFELPGTLLAAEMRRRERIAAKALLAHLSDRQLEDIGLPRGRIDEVLESGAASLAEADARLARRAVASEHREVYEQLLSLDDYLLDDMGLTRGQLNDLLANENRPGGRVVA
ncbi:MAG TPA: DUF1127 domain-containing protein [Alphaproteobacteria bacterium]|nr:DUF1127 domain-containing protein [Alphaproteobacteria bacterium]